MKVTIVKTANAPAPVGPYNQAVKVGNLVFTAGQIALDPETGSVIEGGIEKQTTRVIENLKAVLEAAGSGLHRVVKTTVYLRDMNEFTKMNAVYAGYFPVANAPARSTVQVARLPKDVAVEIEVVAEA